MEFNLPHYWTYLRSTATLAHVNSVSTCSFRGNSNSMVTGSCGHMIRNPPFELPCMIVVDNVAPAGGGGRGWVSDRGRVGGRGRACVRVVIRRGKKRQEETGEEIHAVKAKRKQR